MNTEAKKRTKHRGVYIGLNHHNAALCHGQTGYYYNLQGNVNVEFYADGMSPMIAPIVVPKEHVWKDEVGYANLHWV